MVLGALMKEKARRRGFLEGWAETYGQSPDSPEAYEALSKWLEKRSLVGGYGTPSSARARSEGKAEGVAIGKAAANKDWRAWLQRKEETEAKDRPFNEPPPDVKS